MRHTPPQQASATPPPPLCLPLVAPPPQQPHRTYQRNSICPRGGNLPSTKFNLPAAHTPTTQFADARFSFQRSRHRPLTTATQSTAQNAASQSTPPATPLPLCHTARHAPGNPTIVCATPQVTPPATSLPFAPYRKSHLPPAIHDSFFAHFSAAAPPFSTPTPLFRGLFHISPQNFIINFRFFTFPRIIFTPI